MGGSRTAPRWWGPTLVAIAAVLFAAMAVFGRLAGMHGIPGSEVGVVRFVSGLALGLFLHAFGLAPVKIHRPGWMLVRGLGGGLGNLFLFLALASISDHTPMTNAVLLGNSYFVFAPVFGVLLIKEKLKGTTAIAVILALMGMFLVVDPHLGSIRIGDLYGLLGGIFSGLAIAAVRELRKTESAVSVFFALNLVGTILAVATLLIEKPVMPDALGWLILAAVGVSATCAQFLQTYAFRFIHAGEGSLIAMTTVVYSSAVGVFLIGEPVTWHFIVGAGLVFGSAALMAVQRTGGDDV